MTFSSENNIELDRIRREYARREREITKDFYSLDQPGNRFIYESRLREAELLLKEAGAFPLTEKNVLEVGCGRGGWLGDFVGWGVPAQKLHGIELDPKRLEEAKQHFPGADLRTGDASKLPWPDQHFDLVVQSTVFTSILSAEMKHKIAAEMLRVLKPEGMILWYDFHCNNPKNPNVRGITRKEIAALFPGCVICLKRITLAPPLARALAPKNESLCRVLERLRFLNTHYLAVIRKNRETD